MLGKPVRSPLWARAGASSDEARTTGPGELREFLVLARHCWPGAPTDQAQECSPHQTLREGLSLVTYDSHPLMPLGGMGQSTPSADTGGDCGMGRGPSFKGAKARYKSGPQVPSPAISDGGRKGCHTQTLTPLHMQHVKCMSV